MPKTPIDQTQFYAAQPVLPLRKLPLDTWIPLTLSEKLPWVQEILTEISLDEESVPADLKTSIRFSADIEVKKKLKNRSDEILLVRGDLEIIYSTECVKSLTPMLETLLLPLQLCFYSPGLLEMSGQNQDQTEVVEENKVWQLFFLDQRGAPLAAALKELIYLNQNPYPQIDQ